MEFEDWSSENRGSAERRSARSAPAGFLSPSTPPGTGVSSPDPNRGTGGDTTARDEEVEIAAAGGLVVRGHLSVPEGAVGTVIFAHGSGSSRFSHRNIAVADFLQSGGIATLLFDLLTEEESNDRANIFDIGLLATRLRSATGWLQEQPGIGSLPIGYFGASTGAAAALVAAAEIGSGISALVSRGGRPDLAGPRLEEVQTPTLLIVGGADKTVLQLNRRAAEHLRVERQLVVIPGATHLFEEPGALGQVADLALRWFTGHFGTD